MGFALSPSVTIREIDLSTTIPAVSTNITAMVGKFNWGPIEQRIPITNDRGLIDMFGEPKEFNYEDWYSAWNFLQYGDKLYVTRAIKEEGSSNAGLKTFDTSKFFRLAHGTVANGPFVVGDVLVGQTSSASGVVKSVGTGEVTVIVSTTANFSATEAVKVEAGENDKTATLTASTQEFSAAWNTLKKNSEDNITVTFATNEKLAFLAKYPSVYGNSIKVALANSADFPTAEVIDGMSFVSVFDYAPEGQEVAIVVMDHTNEIVETFIASMDESARDHSGNNIYVEELLNRSSRYIYCLENNTNTDAPCSFKATALSGGIAVAPESGDIMRGYDLYADPEEIDINILIDAANTSSLIQQYIIDAIVDRRRDCVAVLTVPKNEVVGVPQTSTQVNNIIEYRLNTLSRNSSYAAFYGNWKYQYDKYNDKYRWLPCSGDIAGVYAFTDYVKDPWFAPAGLNRGMIKNVVKFALNPNRGFRDLLYKNGINPMVNFPGDGPVIWGQKTLQMKPSAFDRVDVRRLFIVLEKAISTASKYFLFEKNTDFTRRRLVGMIEPFLRDVQGREGIYDFLVVCDETNNSGEVIDRNELICDIYLKPTKTAEFIVLNFIATKTGVNFQELLKTK